MRYSTPSRVIHTVIVTPTPLSSTTKPRVLVVDYDHSTQYFIRILLQDVCLIWEAYSAEMAYTLLEARSFDLVIIAIEQPKGTDGLEVLRAIRALPGCEQLAAIGMIYEASDEQRERLVAEGFSRLVAKLPNPLELRTAVQEVLKIDPDAV